MPLVQLESDEDNENEELDFKNEQKKHLWFMDDEPELPEESKNENVE